MISKNWRVSEKIIVFLFLMFDSVGRINDNLAKNNRKDKGRWRIWTPDGFWRSLSDSRLRPAGRCQWTPCVAPRYNARLPVQSWLLCTVQPVDGQVSGPQVFRKSDHLPHPPPLLNSPSAQNQQRVRKVLKLGLTTLASDPGCVVTVWVEMEKDTLSDPLKEYQEKSVGHKFSG